MRTIGFELNNSLKSLGTLNVKIPRSKLLGLDVAAHWHNLANGGTDGPDAELADRFLPEGVSIYANALT